VKRAFFLLNAAFAMEIVYLISSLHLASFVIPGQYIEKISGKKTGP
jgi:hypothetical protein